MPAPATRRTRTSATRGIRDDLLKYLETASSGADEEDTTRLYVASADRAHADGKHECRQRALADVPPRRGAAESSLSRGPPLRRRPLAGEPILSRTNRTVHPLLAVASGMSYWWASQNKNFRTAIPNGTLWTRPRVNGVMPRNRQALQELVPDDIVFHYGGPFVRAVSRVLHSAIDWPRPADYPRGPRESAANDSGKLVRVAPVATGLTLHRDRVRDLIEWGAPGPLSKHGIPREAYLSPLSDRDADAMLLEVGVELPTRFLPGRPHENWAAGSGATDAEAIARIRTEQGALRAFLLDGRPSGVCGICSRVIKSELLVAGHIVRRSELKETERWNFSAIAMLVCTLGCDALFEHGYAVVNSEGVVGVGRAITDSILQNEMSSRIGKHSPAWTDATAPYFKRHENRHMS